MLYIVSFHDLSRHFWNETSCWS